MTPLSLPRMRPAHAGGAQSTANSGVSLSVQEIESLQTRMGVDRARELVSALSEPDRELRNESLFGMAQRQENAGDLELAADLYASIDTPRARQRLRDLTGNGGRFGARIELQFRQILGETLNPVTILPMLGAGLVFRLARVGTLPWVVRGLGGPSFRLARSALAGLGALSLEATSFTLLRRGVRTLRNEGGDDGMTFERELASNHLNFSGLHLGTSTLGRFSPLLGLLAGAGLAQRLEISAGLRPQQDESSRMADLLATSAQFYLTGRLMERLPILQRIWSRAERWALRSSWIADLHREGNQGRVDLLPAHRARFLSTLQAAVSGEIPEEAARDRLVQVLRDDYIEKIRGLGLQVQEIPWKQWLRDQSRNSVSPLWVARALVDPRGDAWTVHLLDFRNLGSLEGIPDSAMRDCESLTTSGGLNSLLEGILALPPGSLIEPRQEAGFSYMLPVEFLWRSAEHRFGPTAVQAEVLASLASEEHLGALALDNRRPVLVSGRYWPGIHQVNALHPYAAWEHDIYHLLDISTHSPSVRQEIASLYQILRWTRVGSPAEQAEHADLMETLLDGKASQGGDHRILFYRMFSQVQSSAYRDSALRLLRSGLSSRSRGREILEQAEQVYSGRR